MQNNVSRGSMIGRSLLNLNQQRVLSTHRRPTWAHAHYYTDRNTNRMESKLYPM